MATRRESPASMGEVALEKLLSGRFIRSKGATLIAIFAYVAGVHHSQSLGTLLKVLVSLGASVSS